MLDTNMASYIIKGHPPQVRKKLAQMPMECIVISVVTQAELLYGLAKKGHPSALSRLIKEFLLRVKVLPWDEKVAIVYGDLRSACTSSGLTLSALDMMILSHAVATKAIIVTKDKAFSLVPDTDFYIEVEDWSK